MFVQNITKLTKTIDELSARDCRGLFLACPVYQHCWFLLTQLSGLLILFWLCFLYCIRFVFYLLVILVQLSVLAQWLVRKNRLMKPLASRGDYRHKDQVEECVIWFVL